MRTLLGGHGGDGLEEPGGMGNPLLGPAPFVAIVAGPEIDAAAVAVVFHAGDAIGDPAHLGAMAIIGAHVGDVVFSELIHKAN